MNNKIDFSVYLVTDRNALKGKDLLASLEEAIAGGVGMVQLREKDMSSLEFYNMAIKVKELTDRHDIPLIINDRIDIALTVGAAGVHLGQKDIPMAEARKILGDEKIIGISARTIKEAKLAEKQGASYLGVGAMFPTSTKEDTVSVSLDLLKEIKRSVNIPVVGIGGINLENIEKLEGTGIDGVAVVSAILSANDVKKAAQELKKNLVK
ncbi:thiamine phosphate synthase [Alkalicella caledoniensis]|uniref:Thiamine-phosphate synthase n=1 Tax=Alkalicella caledoniensis TaxID=2731377 RepID=A0A7G9W5B3_ALKCA|nr:thiamine phosphate synthase [Alkalicella caledoniensis]QNO13875.1 thiamine phosphate synthase [Alkalicella caledoniensis]